jgi:hypothetical protein
MFINGVRITLLEVVSDNRCPIDAVCIIAGNVTLRVKLESDTDMETATLVSDAAPYGFDAYQVGITSVMPAPTTQYQVQADEYRVQFEVVAN